MPTPPRREEEGEERGRRGGAGPGMEEEHEVMGVVVHPAENSPLRPGFRRYSAAVRCPCRLASRRLALTSQMLAWKLAKLWVLLADWCCRPGVPEAAGQVCQQASAA